MEPLAGAMQLESLSPSVVATAKISRGLPQGTAHLACRSTVLRRGSVVPPGWAVAAEPAGVTRLRRV
ncbi:MAG: hypothetical protein ERJ67_03425 [Aphanocapsa feldmannii 277cV]|uniref:Uncharacterized protein n=1 Tax=Aphanocapsa feldmannii 277cV TaxID=2507553 RepID=A0A524RPF4_9CHRO|nr:MAG: hypothetical protein ERJ67_03425 [Aphanocapsa feldmannii 277cV]